MPPSGPRQPAHRQVEEFMLCPVCEEEACIRLRPGFNLVNCPCCDYCFVVYVDAEGRSWTREAGVLLSRGDDV